MTRRDRMRLRRRLAWLLLDIGAVTLAITLFVACAYALAWVRQFPGIHTLEMRNSTNAR